MRNSYLDWLRGLSIMTVLMTHEVFPNVFAGILPGDLAHNIAKNGYLGVVVFFVISGFLITSRTMARRGDPSQVSVPEFYVLRAARILPLMVLFIVVQIVLFALGEPQFADGPASELYDAVSSILTLQFNNHVVDIAKVFPALTPVWSLSIEELFYLIFPVALIVVRWRSILVVAMVVLILTGPSARQSAEGIYGWSACADSLSLGCIVGFYAPALHRVPFKGPAGILLMLAGAVVIGLQFTFVPIERGLYIGPTVVAVGSALFVAGAHMTPNLSPRNAIGIVFAPLAAAGALSYEIYLFHLTVFYVAYDHLPSMDGAIRSLLQTASIFLVAALLHRFFTQPLNAILRRLWLPASAGVRAIGQEI